MSTHALAETALTLTALAVVAAGCLSWLVVVAQLAQDCRWLPPAWQSALAWGLRAAGLESRLPWMAWQPRRPVPWAFFDLVALVGIWLIVSAVVSEVWRQAGWLPQGSGLDRWEHLPGRAALAANIVVPLLTMAVSLPLIALRTGATLSDLGLAPRRWATDLRDGLVAFVMLAPPVYGVQALLVKLWKPSQHPLIDLFRQSPQVDTFLLLCLSAGVVAPLVEELLFRVLLQGFLEKAVVFRGPVHELVFGALTPPVEVHAGVSPPVSVETDAVAANSNTEAGGWQHEHGSDTPSAVPGDRIPYERPLQGWRGWLPIGLSATLFGLLHYSHGPDWIPLIGLGLGLGYLYRQTHRLVPCCVVHAALNGLSLWGLWVDVFH